MLLILLSSAFAADLITVDSQAMGGVGAANPSSNSAIDLNPSLIALKKRYDLVGVGAIGGSERLRSYGLSAMDSRTTAAAFGFIYTKRVFSPTVTEADGPGWLQTGVSREDRKTVETFGSAIGATILKGRLAGGLSGTASHWQSDRLGTKWRGDLGAGLGATLSKGLTLGLSATHLLPSTEPSAEPTRLVSGLRLDRSRVSAELNAGLTLDNAGPKASLRAGLETRIKSLEMRGGYSLHRGQQALHLGLSVGGEGAYFDYGVQLPLSGGQPVHRLGFRVLLPQSGER